MGERLYPVVAQSGSISAASVTNTTAATASAVLTLNRDAPQVRVTSNFDKDCMLTYGGIDVQFMPAGTGGYVMDFRTNGQYAAAGGVFGVYNIGGTPTTGKCYVQVT